MEKSKQSRMKTRSRKNQGNENENLPILQHLIQNLSRLSLNDRSTFDENYANLDNPGACSRKILRFDNKPKQLIKNVVHSLHGPRRKKFKRRRIIVNYPGQIIEMDLVYMQKLATRNYNYKYILMTIDCFSKKVWARKLKTKKGPETAKAMKSIFEDMSNPVQTIIFDEGKEFYNKYVNQLLTEYIIDSYSILTEKKAGAVERVNRTIKSIIWKYFSEKNTSKWIDVLPKIIGNYNNTFHTTIKMAPNQVNWENRETVFKNMYPKINETVKCKLKKGDKVRVGQYKALFSKGYNINWSRDIYTIVGIHQRMGVCWYKIADSSGKIYPKSKYYYDLRVAQ